MRIEGRNAIRAAIDSNDPQWVAVGIEIVAQQIGGADRNRQACGDRIIAVISGCGRMVVDKAAHCSLGPFDAVCKADGLDTAPVERQRIDDGEAVGGGRTKADHDRLAATEQPGNRRFFRSEIENRDCIAGAGRSGIIVNGVVTAAPAKSVSVAARSPCEKIVACTRRKIVRTIKAVSLVAGACIDARQGTRTHRRQVPDRTIGELDVERIACSQRVGENDPVAATHKIDDKIETVRPAAHGVCDIGGV